MSRRLRDQQTALADQVEWQRSQEVAVISDEDKPSALERTEGFLESSAVGFIVMTIFRGIF